MTLAIGLTRAWVRLYTKGLPPELRDARRAEIESDLWEHGYDGRSNGDDPQETGLQVLYRLLVGVPADLAWRLEQRGAGKTSRNRSAAMSESWKTRGFLVLAVALIALPTIFGISRIAGAGGAGPVYGTGILMAGLVTLAGLALTSSRAKLGLRLTTIGVIAINLLMFWMFFITIPMGIVVFLVARSRARRYSQADSMAPA